MSFILTTECFGASLNLTPRQVSFYLPWVPALLSSMFNWVHCSLPILLYNFSSLEFLILLLFFMYWDMSSSRFLPQKVEYFLSLCSAAQKAYSVEFKSLGSGARWPGFSSPFYPWHLPALVPFCFFTCQVDIIIGPTHGSSLGLDELAHVNFIW